MSWFRCVIFYELLLCHPSLAAFVCKMLQSRIISTWKKIMTHLAKTTTKIQCIIGFNVFENGSLAIRLLCRYECNMNHQSVIAFFIAADCVQIASRKLKYLKIITTRHCVYGMLYCVFVVLVAECCPNN